MLRELLDSRYKLVQFFSSSFLLFPLSSLYITVEVENDLVSSLFTDLCFFSNLSFNVFGSLSRSWVGSLRLSLEPRLGGMRCGLIAGKKNCFRGGVIPPLFIILSGLSDDLFGCR
uniref:Putative secreted protein n=1 Tax=Panstrongylus lignarius TaxID=156445 RepID=A0A224XPX3_9HEMI